MALILPFGYDLWRDVELALAHARRPAVTEDFDVVERALGPYVDHIRDRILEHRAAELRPIQSATLDAHRVVTRALKDAEIMDES